MTGIWHPPFATFLLESVSQRGAQNTKIGMSWELGGGGVMVGLRLLKHRFPASTDSENVSIWSGAQVCEFNKRPAHSDANQV